MSTFFFAFVDVSLRIGRIACDEWIALLLLAIMSGVTGDKRYAGAFNKKYIWVCAHLKNFPSLVCAVPSGQLEMIKWI